MLQIDKHLFLHKLRIRSGGPFSTHSRITIPRIPPPAFDGRRAKNDGACRRRQEDTRGCPVKFGTDDVDFDGIAVSDGQSCMSSNGFGQIGSKTKRGFQDSYKPFLPFQQVSKYDSASFVKALFLV
jgi:hypothetical protein